MKNNKVVITIKEALSMIGMLGRELEKLEVRISELEKENKNKDNKG